MTTIPRVATVSFLLFASGSAVASNYDGLATVMIGFPAFILVNLLLGVFLALQPSRARNIIATAILVPLLILGMSLSHDALSVFKHPGEGWVLSALYFGLLGLSVFLYYKLITRRAGS